MEKFVTKIIDGFPFVLSCLLPLGMVGSCDVRPHTTESSAAFFILGATLLAPACRCFSAWFHSLSLCKRRLQCLQSHVTVLKRCEIVL